MLRRNLISAVIGASLALVAAMVEATQAKQKGKHKKRKHKKVKPVTRAFDRPGEIWI